MASLYFTPTSCGAASYIAAYKAGIIGTKVTPYLTDIGVHKIKSGPKQGADFFAVNPKGNVPTIVLEDGTVLNENAACLQWVADQNPSSGLAPPPGTSARYLLQAKLSYIASEIHANAGPLFSPSTPADAKSFFVGRLKKKLEFISTHEHLQHGKFLMGDDTFTVADSYLYIVLSWMHLWQISLADYPKVKQYWDKIAVLDFVKEAHAAMNKIAEENK